MYLPDLSFYPSINHKENLLFKAVGWLDDQHDFPRGNVSDEFMARLWEFCREPIMCYMGFHNCDFCTDSKDGFGVLAERNGKKFRLGSTTMIVLDGFTANIAYVSPDMIYHYIIVHRYLPPEQFIRAVLNSSSPQSLEYERLIEGFVGM